MLNAIMLNAITLNVIMLNVIVLCVVGLSVIMLNVIAPSHLNSVARGSKYMCRHCCRRRQFRRRFVSKRRQCKCLLGLTPVGVLVGVGDVFVGPVFPMNLFGVPVKFRHHGFNCFEAFVLGKGYKDFRAA
jgi:hypothetical protein